MRKRWGEQRGLVQPFIAAMQVFALALMLIHHDLSAGVLANLLLSIPAFDRRLRPRHPYVPQRQRADLQAHHSRCLARVGPVVGRVSRLFRLDRADGQKISHTVMTE
jgi:hypothetical protein